MFKALPLINFLTSICVIKNLLKCLVRKIWVLKRPKSFSAICSLCAMLSRIGFSRFSALPPAASRDERIQEKNIVCNNIFRLLVNINLEMHRKFPKYFSAIFLGNIHHRFFPCWEIGTNHSVT